MSELPPDRVREHHLSRIREYAVQYDLSGEDIALIFNAGLAAARSLRPDLVEFVPAPAPEHTPAAGEVG